MKGRLVFDSIFFSVPSMKIIEGVYLEVRSGEVCGLFGRNGTGKSTLFRVVTGELPADSGNLVIDGDRIRGRRPRRRFRDLSYLPQNSMLPHDMKAAAVAKSFPAAAMRLLDRPPFCERAGDSMDRFSYGERRYFELMLVLSLDRKYVILDEPFHGLEPILIDRMSERILEAARRGAGILITDQFHQHMLDLVDRAYLMVNRQVRYVGEGPAIREALVRHAYLPTDG
jgi:lipopolysaccharide export system ATP-binding protein